MSHIVMRLGSLLFSSLVTLFAFGFEQGGGNEIRESRVSLKGEYHLREAMTLLAATGNRVVDLRPRLGQEVTDPLLRLDLGDTPFWQAADRLAAQAGLRLTPYLDRSTGLPTLGFQAAAEGESPATVPTAYVGPFRIRLKRLTATRDLADPSANRLLCVLELAAEPRLEPILLRHEADCVRFRFPEQEGKASAFGGTGVIKWTGEAVVEVPIILPLPPRSEKQIKELEVYFSVLVPPRQTQFHLERLAPDQEAMQDGVRLRLSDLLISPGGSRWQVRLRLHYPPGSLPLESHQTWAFERNQFELRHRRTGATLRPQQVEIGIEEGKEIRIAYTFRDMPEHRPEDWELFYRTPAPPVVYPLRFRLSDIPLP